jgi:hypothetical protein
MIGRPLSIPRNLLLGSSFIRGGEFPGGLAPGRSPAVEARSVSGGPGDKKKTMRLDVDVRTVR